MIFAVEGSITWPFVALVTVIALSGVVTEWIWSRRNK